MRGVTLIELLVILALLALVSGMAWPSMTALIERHRGIVMINWIVTAVHVARHTAVNQGSPVTLCALKDNHHCGGAWHKRLMVFTDYNLNAKLDPGEQVVRHIAPLHNQGTLKWRSFKNKPYLQFTAMGYTNYQNGNFVYCPLSGNTKYAKQVVISVQGRLRQVHTRNPSGIPVDRKGKILRC